MRRIQSCWPQNSMPIIFGCLLAAISFQVLALSSPFQNWSPSDDAQWTLLLENTKALREELTQLETDAKEFGNRDTPFPEGREKDLWKLFLALPVRSNQDVLFLRSSIGRVPDAILATVPKVFPAETSTYNIISRLLDIQGHFWTTARRFELLKSLSIRAEKSDSLIQLLIVANLTKKAISKGIVTASPANAMEIENIRNRIINTKDTHHFALPDGLSERIQSGNATLSDYSTLRNAFESDFYSAMTIRSFLLESLARISAA